MNPFIYRQNIDCGCGNTWRTTTGWCGLIPTRFWVQPVYYNIDLDVIPESWREPNTCQPWGGWFNHCSTKAAFEHWIRCRFYLTLWVNANISGKYVSTTRFPRELNHDTEFNVFSVLLKSLRKEGNVLFNDALNTFYLRLYGVRHMVKDHTDSERGNPLPPHGLLFPISSKGSFICPIPQTGLHISRPLSHQLWSTGWNEK